MENFKFVLIWRYEKDPEDNKKEFADMASAMKYQRINIIKKQTRKNKLIRTYILPIEKE